ncbi:MAG TPA: hypothetical protein VFK70_09805 [Vicinamibacteria bacterium]|nr:hypothetical protein [Vicinamibacteria bacterium]
MTTGTRPAPGGYCPVHKAPHGPRGCPRCLQAAAAAHREEQRQLQKKVLIIGAPILLLGLFLVLRPTRKEPARLDPTPYRPMIEAMESVIYSPDRPTRQDRQVFGDAARALVVALNQTFPSGAQKRALEALQPFLMLTDVEATHWDSLDVANTRMQWESLRVASFESADWFKTGSMALREAQTSATSRGVAPDAAVYQQALEQLKLLEAQMEFVLDGMPQSGNDGTPELQERYQAAERSAKSGIEVIRQNYPAPPHNLDRTWVKAYNDLEAATRAIPTMVRGSINGVPNHYEGQMRIKSARFALTRAQESLDGALR